MLDLKPGDLYTFECGGVRFTEHFEPPKPAVYPTLSRRQRIMRKLTPPRWRKPLQPIRTDPLARQQRMMAGICETFDELGAW
ncbi:hypothetical protein [Mycobacterium intracellulare]|uniref:Uncharacterized protein n=1 Tax=Mycobacterium intracellulare TaxID=1767 RepID=A0AAE4U4J1_MYCIT|nr:hypothetical protein [Mycobacterium intracellulare]MDV6979642.1 hypothetical protein [Mycobacterium intracellulare]MDV6985145.1 hypothetical protein [Mycobacterium intracellulare]MDV7014235.1 hypothetical protein [Mycobacterium intracellulare]MDV7030136.1 hypothetical protein [Mycobacterium intracellulare]